MKVEVEIGRTRAEKIRALDAAREKLRATALKAREYENTLSTIRYSLDDQSKAVAKLEAEVASEFLLAVLPAMNEPQPAPGEEPKG